MFAAQSAAIAACSSPRFRVIHFSVQSDHVHLLAEARDAESLSRGIIGLMTSTARAINRILRRRGPVWTGRYHRHDLATPREVRNCINYILQNRRKHVPGTVGVDPCSSGPWFNGWLDLPIGARAGSRPPVAPPTTWLASTGWRRHGLLSLSEIPGRSRRASRGHGGEPRA